MLNVFLLPNLLLWFDDTERGLLSSLFLTDMRSNEGKHLGVI